MKIKQNLYACTVISKIKKRDIADSYEILVSQQYCPKIFRRTVQDYYVHPKINLPLLNLWLVSINIYIHVQYTVGV
jgi:hypothetical protein